MPASHVAPARRRRHRAAPAAALLATGVAAALVSASGAAADTTPKPRAGQVPGTASYGGGAITPRVDAFYVREDRKVVAKRNGNTGGLGGLVTSGVSAAATWTGTHVNEAVYGRGNDGAVWHRDWVGATGEWLPWASLGGQTRGTPSVSMVGEPAQPVVYSAGTDGSLLRRTPAGWGNLGRTIIGDPAGIVATGGAATLSEEVFVIGTDYAVWQWRRLDGWHKVGGRSAFAPAATLLPDGSTDLFAIGADKAIWVSHRNSGTNVFGAFVRVGGSYTSAPSAVVDITPPAKRVVYALGTDGHLWRQTDIIGGADTWTQTQVP
jgi:hypothetical protein